MFYIKREMSDKLLTRLTSVSYFVSAIMFIFMVYVHKNMGQELEFKIVYHSRVKSDFS